MCSGFISGLAVQAEVIQGHLLHAVGYIVVLFDDSHLCSLAAIFEHRISHNQVSKIFLCYGQ